MLLFQFPGIAERWLTDRLQLPPPPSVMDANAGRGDDQCPGRRSPQATAWS